MPAKADKVGLHRAFWHDASAPLVQFVMPKKLIYKPKSNTSVILNALQNALLTILVIAMITVAHFALTHEYYTVKGSSMEPNILQASSSYAGDACYVDKGAKFTYGDIIVASKTSTTDIVKRIIAMGGDKVGVYYDAENAVYEVVLIKQGYDAEILAEDYLYQTAKTQNQKDFIKSRNQDLFNKFQNLEGLEDAQFNGEDIKVLTVPEDHLFLLGDNRHSSIDSSSYGTLHQNKVVGKVELVVKQNTIPAWAIISHVFGFEIFG